VGALGRQLTSLDIRGNEIDDRGMHALHRRFVLLTHSTAFRPSRRDGRACAIYCNEQHHPLL
jgi:hypothetical protein